MTEKHQRVVMVVCFVALIAPVAVFWGGGLYIALLRLLGVL